MKANQTETELDAWYVGILNACSSVAGRSPSKTAPYPSMGEIEINEAEASVDTLRQQLFTQTQTQRFTVLVQSSSESYYLRACFMPHWSVRLSQLPPQADIGNGFARWPFCVSSIQPERAEHEGADFRRAVAGRRRQARCTLDCRRAIGPGRQTAEGGD